MRGGCKWALVAAIALTVAAVPAGAVHSDDGQFSCLDPRGCPDVVPNARGEFPNPSLETETFDADDCAVQEGYTEPGERRLLRFGTVAWNLGEGDVFVGNPLLESEQFDFETCHGHPHFGEHAAYRLWTPSGWDDWKSLREANPHTSAETLLENNPDLEDEFVAGNKIGFCLVDSFFPGEELVEPDPVGFVSAAPKYLSCQFQGISAGNGDLYSQSLDGQWVDVTGLPSGDYVLENELDPNDNFVESDETNNWHGVPVTI